MPDSTTTTVEGADVFVATLGRAAADLAALAPPEAGAYVRDKARGRAPIVSGTLRASVTATEGAGRVSVGSGLVYAPVIHNGWPGHGISPHPFLIPVAEETAPVWGRMYQAETEQIVHRVRGA
jgi:hypothetical protein